MIRIIGAIVAVLLAVGGGVALYLWVQGAERRAAQGAEFEPVYIVTEPVPKGTAGEAIEQFIEVDELPVLSIQPGIVTDLSDLEGLVSNADLLAGEQLLEGRFTSPEDLAADGEVVVPDGYQEITVALPVERVVGGAVAPGNTVGVVISSNTLGLAANDLTASTQFVYHRVLVTRVTPGRTLVAGSADEDESREVSAFLVTLAVTTTQVEKIAYAAEQQEDGNGGIWLTLEPETADPNGSNRRSGENIFQ